MELIDANIILRYVLKDNEELANKAKQIIEENDIHVTFEVIAEVVYVLEKLYKVERLNVHKTITGLFVYSNISTVDFEVLNQGFEFYSESNFDFVDSILLGYYKVRGNKIHTFDKKMNKFMKK